MVGPVAALLRGSPLKPALWLLIAVLTYLYAASDIGYAIAHGDWQSSRTTMLGRDFVNVFTSGHLVLEGQLAGIYDVPAYQDYQSKLLGEAIDGHNYSYAPITFFFVWLFALLPYGLSYCAWIALTGAAFVFAARPYLKDAGLPAWAALLLPAAAANIWAGHYGFLVGALWLGGWRVMESRPKLAGLMFGLLAIKPHMALLLPLVLAWRGEWVAFRFAAYTVCALVAGSGLLFGWDLWAVYLTETAMFQASLLSQTQAFYMMMMPSIVPSLGLAGATAAVSWAVQAVVAVCVVAALLRRMPRDGAAAGLATAVATVLVVPYSFNYDLAAAGVFAICLLYSRSAATRLERGIAAAALLLPLLLPFLGIAGLPLGPVVMGFLLWAALRGPGEAVRLPRLRGEGARAPMVPLEKA